MCGSITAEAGGTGIGELPESKEMQTAAYRNRNFLGHKGSTISWRASNTVAVCFILLRSPVGYAKGARTLRAPLLLQAPHLTTPFGANLMSVSLHAETCTTCAIIC